MSELVEKIAKWVLLLLLGAVIIYFLWSQLSPGHGGLIDTFFGAGDKVINTPPPVD